MSFRWILCLAAAAAAALAVTQVSSSAQTPNPLTCPKRPSEGDLLWSMRCAEEDRKEQEQRQLDKEDAERRTRAMLQQLRETDRQRAILEKQPPLPAARNRLLGRWATSVRPSQSNDPFAQLAAMFEGCNVLLGDAIVEFGPDRWAIHDADGRNDMGAISYRAGTNGAVYGLPAKGSIFNLLPFEFETPDRIRLIGVVCTLARTNAAPGGPATRGTPPPARGASPPAPASAAPTAQANAAFEEALGRKYRGRFGYDCPNGADVAVESCTSEAANADCVIVRVDQPPKNGALVTFNETRAALIKRIASCTMKPLRVVDGKLGFAP